MPHSTLFSGLVRLLQQARRENLSAAGEAPPVVGTPQSRSRRRFLKTTGGIGLAAALPACTLAPEPAGTAPPRIAIVGGGIAGLNAAYQLKKTGLNATVYEARQRLGGRMFSVTGAVGEGLATNLGGTLINTDHQDMRTLARELGVPLFNRVKDAAGSPFPPIRYFFQGRFIEESELAQALRPLAHQITRDADRIDADWDRHAPALDRLSVADYLDRHAGLISQPYVRDLMEQSVRAEFGAEPGDSSALQLLFNLPTVDGRRVEVLSTSDEAFVVEGGSSRIIQALHQVLDGQIRTGMALTAVRSQGEGFRLSFAGHPDVEADYVVLAMPFTTLRQVELTVELPPLMRRFIHELDLGRNEKLIAGFQDRVWRQADGFVIESWTDLDFNLVWEATPSQTNRDNAALTFFFGGDLVDRLQQGSTSQRGRSVVAQFERLIPGAGQAANGRYLRTHWSRDRFTQGAYANFKPGQLTTFGDLLYVEGDDESPGQDVHVGRLVFAGEHLSDAYYGFMNGGAQTGRLAANLLARWTGAGQTTSRLTRALRQRFG